MVYKPKKDLTDAQKLALLWAAHNKDTHLVIDERTYNALSASDKNNVETATEL